VSLRLWRAPQPYFKLRFCSLIAFGPDCSHFPSAIPNMRENGADLVSAVCEACLARCQKGLFGPFATLSRNVGSLRV
jgi:hypothetical protein